jgi:hypothetical protein
MTGWRKRTIMEMAREVKMPYDFVTGEPINIEKLEAFAELVREDEHEALEKIDWTALLRDGGLVTWGAASELGNRVVAAIRAKGQS